MAQEKTIDEIFGGSWHLDWKELPDTCKAWLIEKSSECSSSLTQESTIDEVVDQSWCVDWSSILEKDWNRHRQTLTQLDDPKHTNIRRQKAEMLLWQNRVRTPEQKEADEQELDQTLRAPAKENGKLKKNKLYCQLDTDLGNVNAIRPASMPDYDRQIEERARLNHAITSARAPLTAAKRKLDELLGIYVEEEPELKNLVPVEAEPELKNLVPVGDKQSQPTRRDGDILKRERSAFLFGRAYQAALTKGTLSEPLSASGLKTAPKQIAIALGVLGLKLSDTKISELVKSILDD